MAHVDYVWVLPSSPVVLLPDEVHVWRASLQVSPATCQSLLALLSSDEQDRAARFRFPHDHRRFVVAHAILRQLLARYLQTDASRLLFSTNPYGKPSLAPALNPAGLHFNLSHSHDIALFAFSYRRELGVDVEYTRKEVEYDQLARFCFSDYEQHALFPLTGMEKHTAFYNCWTRKEAYIKARGLGLSLPLHLFDVSLLPADPARLLDSRESAGEVARWSLQALTPGPEYAAALAAEGQDWLLRRWHWSADPL